jgi:hypothetical protein
MTVTSVIALRNHYDQILMWRKVLYENTERTGSRYIHSVSAMFVKRADRLLSYGQVGAR